MKDLITLLNLVVVQLKLAGGKLSVHSVFGICSTLVKMITNLQQKILIVDFDGPC